MKVALYMSFFVVWSTTAHVNGTSFPEAWKDDIRCSLSAPCGSTTPCNIATRIMRTANCTSRRRSVGTAHMCDSILPNIEIILDKTTNVLNAYEESFGWDNSSIMLLRSVSIRALSRRPHNFVDQYRLLSISVFYIKQVHWLAICNVLRTSHQHQLWNLESIIRRLFRILCGLAIQIPPWEVCRPPGYGVIENKRQSCRTKALCRENQYEIMWNLKGLFQSIVNRNRADCPGLYQVRSGSNWSTWRKEKISSPMCFVGFIVLMQNILTGA